MIQAVISSNNPEYPQLEETTIELFRKRRPDKIKSGQSAETTFFITPNKYAIKGGSEQDPSTGPMQAGRPAR